MSAISWDGAVETVLLVTWGNLRPHLTLTPMMVSDRTQQPFCSPNDSLIGGVREREREREKTIRQEFERR